MGSHVEQLIRLQASVADIATGHAQGTLQIQGRVALIPHQRVPDARNKFFNVIQDVADHRGFEVIPLAPLAQFIGHVLTQQTHHVVARLVSQSGIEGAGNNRLDNGRAGGDTGASTVESLIQVSRALNEGNGSPVVLTNTVSSRKRRERR